jgi:hypothetical protein
MVMNIKTLPGVAFAFAVSVMLASGLAACAGTHGLAAKADCAVTYQEWYRQPAIKHDFRSVETLARDVHATQQQLSRDAGSLGTAAQVVLRNPPPGCVPGLRGSVDAAMLQAVKASRLARRDSAYGAQRAEARLRVAGTDLEAAANDVASYVR